MSPWARAPQLEYKASNCPRTATASRLGMLPFPDMCDHIKSPLGLKRHPHLKLRPWSCLVSSQGVASPPLPNGCGRQLQGPQAVQGPDEKTCSQASEERTNEARAMAISLGPRRDQGPLKTSARASRRTSRIRVCIRPYPRTKRSSSLRRRSNPRQRRRGQQRRKKYREPNDPKKKGGS